MQKDKKMYMEKALFLILNDIYISAKPAKDILNFD